MINEEIDRLLRGTTSEKKNDSARHTPQADLLKLISTLFTEKTKLFAEPPNIPELPTTSNISTIEQMSKLEDEIQKVEAALSRSTKQLATVIPQLVTLQKWITRAGQAGLITSEDSNHLTTLVTAKLDGWQKLHITVAQRREQIKNNFVFAFLSSEKETRGDAKKLAIILAHQEQKPSMQIDS